LTRNDASTEICETSHLDHLTLTLTSIALSQHLDPSANMELPKRPQRAETDPRSPTRKATPQDMGRSYCTPTPARESFFVPCESLYVPMARSEPTNTFEAEDQLSPLPRSAPAAVDTRMTTVYNVPEPPATPSFKPSSLQQYGLLTPRTPSFSIDASSPPSHDLHKSFQSPYGLHVQARTENIADIVDEGKTAVDVHTNDAQTGREAQDDVYDPPHQLTAGHVMTTMMTLLIRVRIVSTTKCKRRFETPSSLLD
jgi:hypothetical protein